MAKAYQNASLITSILEISFGVAISLDQTTITTEHILFGMLQTRILNNFFKNRGIEVGKLCKELYEYIESNGSFLKNNIASNDPQYMTGQLTGAVNLLFETVQGYAAKEQRNIDISDILLGLINIRDSYASYFMNKYGITEDIILELRKGHSMNPIFGAEQNNNNATDALSEHCVNLNEKVKKSVSDPLIGRDKEILTIAHTLSKRKKSNVALIGDPGVGKSMIVEGLAQRINEGKVPDPLKNKIIFSLDIGSLIAGCKFRGDYEEKIKSILEELSTRTDAILFIDEAHQMDSGEGKGQMGVGLSSMIKPLLSRGVIKVIAAATWEGYRSTFEKDAALMRRFRVVVVDEPSVDDTIAILAGTKKSVEEFHNVEIQDSAIKAAVELTVKYQPEKRLPDKAIDVLDSACARKKVVTDENNIIDSSSIIRELREITGIPINDEVPSDENAKNILTLANRVKSVVFHQDTAIDNVSKCLVISKAGLRNPKKPIGGFLLVGPSGVGKTLFAETLAAEMNMSLLRYDMSEFQEKHTVSSLIGAPPSYVGFGDGAAGEGRLINDVIKNQNSVILFDEVEKAHPDIFNIFLQMLDNGEVAGTTGKIANFRNSIIIMTSNLGTKEGAKNKLGFIDQKSGKSASSNAVDNFFLTEIRGRLTSIIEFEPLDDLSYRKIVYERINDIAKLISNKNVHIVPSESLVNHILSLNNSTQYGARRISRIVEEIINYPLSIKLLNGDIEMGNTINLDWSNNELVIEQKTSNVPFLEVI